jgi:hypothetical protein
VNITKIQKSNVVPGVVFLVLTIVLYIVHYVERGGVMTGNNNNFDASKDVLPFFITGAIIGMVLLLRVQNFVSPIYSFIVVDIMITMENIIGFVDLYNFVTSDATARSIAMLLIIHSCLMAIQVILLVWLLKKNLSTLPFACSTTGCTLPINLPVALYFAMSIAGIGLFINYTDDASPIGAHIFGVISLLLFMLAKSDACDLYVSIIPGLLICVGINLPLVNTLIYEKSSASYSALNLLLIVGLSILLLAQLAAVVHSSILAVQHVANNTHTQDRYQDLPTTNDGSEVDDTDTLLSNTNARIN